MRYRIISENKTIVLAVFNNFLIEKSGFASTYMLHFMNTCMSSFRRQFGRRRLFTKSLKNGQFYFCGLINIVVIEDIIL
jgi:hypothetical protein